MQYPESMTAQDIEQFEYELNRMLDIDRDEGLYWAVNAELQIAAQEQRDRELSDLSV